MRSAPLRPRPFIPRAQRQRGQSVFSGILKVNRYDAVVRVALLFGITTITWHIFRLVDANLTVSDIAFLTVILLLLVRGTLNLRPFGTTTAIWSLSLIAMLGGLFISTVVNGDPWRWASVAAQYTAAYLALPMMLASFDRRMLDRCLVFFVLGVTLSQAVAVIASLFVSWDDTAALLGNDFITGTGRIGAFSGNANTNGAMATFALLVMIYCLQKGFFPRWLAVICGVILGWGLLGSASFTSFVLASVSISAMLVVLQPQKFFKYGLPLIGATIAYILAGLPLPGPFQARVGEALMTGDMQRAGTFTGRSALADEAWRFAGDTLFIGFGADGYRVVSEHQAPVHVFPLLLLTEGGLVALAGFVGMLAIMWTAAFNLSRRDRADAALAFGVLLVFTGFTVAVPHMYARLWIGPVLLVLMHGYAAYSPTLFQGFGSPAMPMAPGTAKRPAMTSR
jgi:hypothetical protein